MSNTSSIFMGQSHDESHFKTTHACKWQAFQPTVTSNEVRTCVVCTDEFAQIDSQACSKSHPLRWPSQLLEPYQNCKLPLQVLEGNHNTSECVPLCTLRHQRLQQKLQTVCHYTVTIVATAVMLQPCGGPITCCLHEHACALSW